ncbi:hypothetical protein RHSIM_Rhsim09G0086200 [Rhododendron simsii]|uniref:DDE Tnp4 domain-containing protein n=1 Tax=Rhododendron simsii TaxID=118357 RepID=A0A834GF23_RHOSS|nr:hypothetical protein RHSIM_Rhsim09G0086200 [Rhododendron simsii]
MDGDEEYDYDIYDEDMRQQRLDAARQQRRVDAAQGIINIHNDAYMVKEPCRTSALTGAAWIAELNVGHPKHEFYLVDAGYPNTRGFLAPYKGCIYHTPEWRNGAIPRNAYEKFNKIHSSLRCTIERTFGVWKARWPLVCDIPVGYTIETQRELVSTTMAIHNFIRRSNMPDIPFGFYDRRPNFLPSDAGVETTAPNGQHGHVFIGDDQNMENVRASIRDWIVANRIR